MTLGNVFGREETSYGGGVNIWHRTYEQYPAGGTISNASDFYAKGVIPAGSMCQYDQSAKTIKIVLAKDIKTASQTSGKVEPKSILGLLYNDVYVKDGMANAAFTGAVVRKGMVYADRLAEEVPEEVWAVLPGITPVREK